jgi:predicted phosphodiesterase
MKIKLISDLHLDAHLIDPTGKTFLSKIPKDNVDVLVVAGDIVTNGHIDEYEGEFQYLCDNYPHVVYVLGNHDYYKSTVQGTFDVMSGIQSRISNFHWLQNSKKEIGGVTFAGTTLWFPEVDYMPGKNSWIDFRHVQNLRHEFVKEHEAARQFVKNDVNSSDILVVHHIPHNMAIHSDYLGDDYNCYFLGDISDLLDAKDLPYVFFGHSHQYIDRQIKETQYILNPRGYPQEWGRNGFNPDLIIDTDLDKLK